MKNIKVIAITVFLVLSSFVAISYAAFNENSKVDIQIVKDLAVMSELSNRDINRLYASVKDWDKVSENIMIYKQILKSSDANNFFTGQRVFDYIGKYNANDLLQIYEFLNANKLGLDKANKILKNYDKTKEIDLYQAFDKYKPASKEEIVEWLNKGILPDDVLNADAIAMQKDMTIAKVFELKTDKNTWDDISKNLSYVKETPKTEEVFIRLGKGDKAKIIKDKDFGKIAEKMNQETKINDGANKTIEGLNDAEKVKLEKKGLKKQEMKNIVKLSKESGKTIDEIIQSRGSTMDWKEVIKKYERTE